MEKIANYIKNGKGLGLLFLLAASVLITLVIMLNVKDIYKAIHPQALLIAEDILPLTIQNHKVVAPTNAYKELNLSIGDTKTDNFSFPIVLDTRSESSEMPKAKQGLYIMTDALYMISPAQIRRIEYKNDGVIDLAAFENLANSLSSTFFIIAAIGIISAFFLSALFKTWLAALIGLFGQKFITSNTKYDIGILMRLCAVLTAGIEVLSFILSLTLHNGLTGFQIFVIVTIIELIAIYNEKKKEI